MQKYPALLLIFSACLAAASARAECVPEENVPVCLSGVAIAGDYAAALISESGKPGMRRVRKGDKVEDWTVEEIGPRYVVFNRAGDSVQLNLTKEDKMGATSASAKADEESSADSDDETDEDGEAKPKAAAKPETKAEAKPKPAPDPSVYDPRFGPGHRRKDN